MLINGDRAFSIAETAEILKQTRQTIYSHIRSGKLEAVRVGDRNYILKSALAKYAKEVMHRGKSV